MPSRARIRWIASLMLAWFAITLGTASASALLKQPQFLGSICSGSGGLLVLTDQDDQGPPMADRGADCPLCTHMAAGLIPQAPQSPEPPLRAIIPARTPCALAPNLRADTPPPARGPPRA